MKIHFMLAPVLACAGLGLAGCETVADAVEKGVTASLTGSQEVPGPGDPDGSGSAEITSLDSTDQICYDIKVRNIDMATAAHIHRGGPGVAGPPVVTLEAPTDGDSKGCVSVPGAIADEIEGNPAAFYVNVHNAAYPNGAVRGQLAL
ncbi:MAG: CHRD domain-containing protein [Sphingosinicella sp.]|nr:CHRD domain-containing protein [Sphingosinicella sp.]